MVSHESHKLGFLVRLRVPQPIRSVAQPGSAPGLGPGGPRFDSLYSDQFTCRVKARGSDSISPHLFERKHYGIESIQSSCRMR